MIGKQFYRRSNLNIAFVRFNSTRRQRKEGTAESVINYYTRSNNAIVGLRSSFLHLRSVKSQLLKEPLAGLAGEGRWRGPADKNARNEKIKSFLFSLRD